jgi:CRISPR-associated endonuclease/helicase Cas3
MSGMNKAERLTEMKRLYIQRAYSDIEMAKRLGVARETVYRDRIELTAEYPIEPDREGRYRIVRSKLFSEIKVSLHEALTLYLAARRTSRQTRFYHPHAASAVEKLAAVLRQPMTERLLRTADHLLQQEKDPERVKILEILTQAWVEQYKVRIRYQGLKSAGVTNHVISPYFIEPSIWSDSVYVVAYSDTFEKTMPFKVDRIQRAVLSGEPFAVPETFDDQQLLKYAWGIWYGDAEPVTVKLRFSRAVTKRVKESIWHPLEKVENTVDGGCTWSVEIAEWREMLPWVRSWGADVEVIEPKELRETLMGESKAMAENYGWFISSEPSGKSSTLEDFFGDK